MSALPRIAITVGEPAGIGPDIVLAAAAHSWDAELVAVGDPQLLAARAAHLGLSVTLRETAPGGQARAHQPGALAVVPVPLVTPCRPGILDPANAAYVLQTLQLAVDGCLAGDFSAMVTAPVQKSVINDAGIAFTGHTEFLAAATGTERVVMMLATAELRVALATTHLPLAAVPAAITPNCCVPLYRYWNTTCAPGSVWPRRASRCWASTRTPARGHLGREELDVIIPTLEELRAGGMHLQGPLPADTAFNPRVLRQCDAVFAMYHDQGLPVLKYSGFGNAVNITLGLPIIRTSVDHGTALDLAGSGAADPGSLLHALGQAIAMSVASGARDRS